MTHRIATVLGTAVLLTATLAATPEAVRTALAPGSPLRAKLLSIARSSSGPVTEEYTPVAAELQPPPETPIDVGAPAHVPVVAHASGLTPAPAPAACTPQVTKARGKVTSNGYLAIEGTCFGQSGLVLIGGVPPNSTTAVTDPIAYGVAAFPATTQLWTPVAVTVQLPLITGVTDTTIHVYVKTGSRLSKPFDAKFTAALGQPVALPSRYITNNECGGGAIPGLCDAQGSQPAIGSHADFTQQSGADIWTMTIPEHWHLAGIHLVHLVKGATSTSVINGGGNVKTFKVSWTEDPNSYTTGTQSSSNASSWDSIFSDIVTGGAAVAVNTGSSTAQTRVTLYTEAYRIEPLIRGPAGMLPAS